MTDTISGIMMNFGVAYDNDKINYRTHLKNAFSRAEQIGGMDCVNKCFIKIMYDWNLSLEEFKIAIEEGVDPRYNDDMPFIYSCKYTPSTIAHYLLETYNADIHAHNNLIFSYPGIYIIDNCLIQTLLDRGTEIDLLMVHCLCYPDKLKIIIDRGTDLNLILKNYIDIENSEYTATISDSKYNAKILLDAIINSDKSIDINILNIFLEKNISIFDLDSIKIFINLGADPRFNNDSIFIKSCAVAKQKIEIPFYFLSDCNCDINAQNSKALLYSIEVYNLDISRFLLDFGAKVFEKHISQALINGHAYVTLLLNSGVSLELIAEVYVDNIRNLQIVKLLINKGASLDAIITSQ